MPVQWFHSLGAQTVLGPCTDSELRLLGSTGLLLLNDRIRKQEMVHPVPANRIKNLFAASGGHMS
jgi:hypothetical protein